MTETRLISASRIRHIVSVIDLTNLADNCDVAAIETLCAQARTPVGHVAAICIWPTFVVEANRILGKNSPVNIATVVNFPSGDEPMNTVLGSIDKALSNGADEIDYVLPYNELINGNIDLVTNTIKSIRKQVQENKTLKVILETGKLNGSDLIQTAAQISIDQGADFIKTSTGKVPVNATPEAAIIMLDAIALSKKDIGFKAAGGIKSIDDANVYLTLSEERLGQDWADSSHFRFGASSLLQDALTNLDVNASSTGDNGEY